MKNFKIFISSPGDVRQERVLAQKIIEKLNVQLKEYISLEPYFWEREPLVATSDFQSLILPPSKCDIVIVILWSRLGKDLDKDKYYGEYTNKVPVTGTEWEFEEAYKAHLLNNKTKPSILVYKKNENFNVLGNDEEALNEAIIQKKKLDTFFDNWFLNEDKSFKGALHEFMSLKDFEELFEIQITALVKDYIQTDAVKNTINWFKGSPFKGLESFEKEDSQIFFGRNYSINEIFEQLTNQIKNNTAFLMLLGASGSGKSSFLKAGLLPRLLLPNMIDNVAIVRYAILLPSNCNKDLVRGLIDILFKETALCELEELYYKKEDLYKKVKNDLINILDPIKQVFSHISHNNNLLENSGIKLILLIDQFEEIFTLKDISIEDRKEFIELLGLLSKSGFVFIVSSMRSDFFTYLESDSQLVNMMKNDGKYILSFPSEAEIDQIILKPVHEAGCKYEIDDKTNIPLNEVIKKSMLQNKTSLPLLEYMLNLLWQQRDKNLITYQSYHSLGGLENIIGNKAEDVYKSLDQKTKEKLPKLIRLLSTLTKENQEFTSKKVDFKLIEKDSSLLELGNVFLSKDVRLIVKDSSNENTYIRMAHESIFKYWYRAKKILIEEFNYIQLRDRLESQSVVWKTSKDEDKNSLLLNTGLPIEEAKNIYENRKDELSDKIIEYIEASILHIKKKEKKKKVYITVFLTFLIFIVIVLLFLINAVNEEKNKIFEKEKALSKANENLKASLEIQKESFNDLISLTWYSFINQDLSDGKLDKVNTLNKILATLKSNDIERKEKLISIMLKYFSKKGVNKDNIKELDTITTFEQMFSNILFRKPKYVLMEIAASKSFIWYWDTLQLKTMYNLFDFILFQKKLPKTFQRYSNLTNEQKEELKYIHALLKFLLEPNTKNYQNYQNKYKIQDPHFDEKDKTPLYLFLNYDANYKYIQYQKEKLNGRFLINQKDINERFVKLSRFLYNELSKNPKNYKRKEEADIKSMYYSGLFSLNEEYGKTYNSIKKSTVLKEDKSKKEILKLLAIQEDNYHLLKLLSFIYFLEQDYKKVYDLSNELLNLFPFENEFLTLRKKALLLILENQEINSFINISTKKEKDNLYSYYKNLSWAILELNKDYNKSILNLNLALKYAISKKNKSSIYSSLSWYYLFTKEYDKALKSSQKAISLNPKGKWVYTNMAHAYLFLGEIEKAKEIYLKYKDVKVHSSKRLFKKFVSEDFSKFEEEGITSEYFDVIRESIK